MEGDEGTSTGTGGDPIQPGSSDGATAGPGTETDAVPSNPGGGGQPG